MYFNIHNGMRLKNMMDIVTYIYVTDLEQITDSDFNDVSKTLKHADCRPRTCV